MINENLFTKISLPECFSSLYKATLQLTHFSAWDGDEAQEARFEVTKQTAHCAEFVANFDAEVSNVATDFLVPQAVKTLQQALREDLDFAWSYHCNIAVAFQDEGGDYKTSNRAAARFMKLFADVDTTKHPAYPG